MNIIYELYAKDGTHLETLNYEDSADTLKQRYKGAEIRWRQEKSPRTPESLILQKFPAGTVFYTDKPENVLTGHAKFYERKIKTERVYHVTADEKPEEVRLTKVTILK